MLIGAYVGAQLFSWFASSPELAGSIACGLSFLCTSALATPGVRTRLSGRLAQMDAQGMTNAAACISALVGQVGQGAALLHARREFRGLPFPALSADDLASSADSGLFAKTVAVELRRGCDAFVSHSWHDLDCLLMTC